MFILTKKKVMFLGDSNYNVFCKLRWYLEPYKDYYIKMVLRFTLLQTIFNFLLVIYVQSIIGEGKVYLDSIDKAIFILVAFFLIWNICVIFTTKKNQNHFILFAGLFFGTFSVVFLYESCKLMAFLFNDAYLLVVLLVVLFYLFTTSIIVVNLKKHVISGKKKSMVSSKTSIVAGSLAVLGVVVGRALSKSSNGQNGLLVFIFALQALSYFFATLTARNIYKYFLLEKYREYVNK